MTASGSTEAESIAAFAAAPEAAQHPRFVLKGLGFQQECPTEIHTDGQAASDDQKQSTTVRHQPSGPGTQTSDSPAHRIGGMKSPF